MTDVSTLGAKAEVGRESPAKSFMGLLWVLSLKNFQVRYKRASLGVAWAVVQPAFQAAFLSFVFLKILHIGHVRQYPLYVLSGMLPWSFFAQSVAVATTAVVDNGPLVKKVALPKVVFPLSAIGGVALAFVASVAVLLVGALIGGHLGWQLLYLPVALVLEVLVVAALGTLTCAYQVAFRDVKYVVDSLMIVGFYGTPIVYSLKSVPHQFQPVLWCNPMTGVMQLYRAAVLDLPIDGRPVVVGCLVSLVSLLAAVAAFRSRSDEFADLV